MIDDQLRNYASAPDSASAFGSASASGSSRLRAEEVLAHARRSHRRRRAALVAATGGLTAAVIVLAALVLRVPAPAPVPSVTVAVPGGCQVTTLPLPPGVTGATVTGADPTGRFVVGAPFPSDDTAPAVTVLWTDGTPRLLPTGFLAAAVSSSGLVVGTRGRLEDRRAAILRDGAVTDLPLPDGAVISDAVAVNGRGEIAGIVYYPDYSARAVVWPPAHDRARLLQAGSAGKQDTMAAGIGEDGTVVGTVGERERAYRWASDGTGVALRLPEGYRSSEGQAITGDWAIGVASTSRGGEDGKEELVARSTPVRWNLATGAIDHGFPVVPVAVDGTGAIAGRGTGEQATVWRDGTVFTLPSPEGRRAIVSGFAGDSHTLVGHSDRPGGLAPVVWHGC
ncbi:hypothetical protein [Dactylosporangium cerinum]